MDPPPTVHLKLIDDLGRMLDHHCSLCLFFHDTQSTCTHHRPGLRRLGRASSSFSDDCSFYTARTSSSDDNSDAESLRLPPVPSRSSRRVRMIPLRPTDGDDSHRTSSLWNVTLRRKTSPTNVSLRELSAQHSSSSSTRRSLLSAQDSEEALQRVYESQIRVYLDGGFADLASLRD